jgi:hypothetical protein
MVVESTNVRGQLAARRVVDLEGRKLGDQLPAHLLLRDAWPPAARPVDWRSRPGRGLRGGYGVRDGAAKDGLDGLSANAARRSPHQPRRLTRQLPA